MKILHITNNYPTANYPIFGIFVKEQIDSLKVIGLECDVFFINGKEKGTFEYLKCIGNLKKMAEKNNYDIIHCHHAFSALTALLFARVHKNVPVVVSFQNDPSDESKLNLYNLLFKYTSAFIFKNNSKYANPPKGYYLSNGVNTSLFKPLPREVACQKLQLDPSKRYILFVSSNCIRKQKRYDRFLAVINLLVKKYDLEDIKELKLINIQRELVPYYFNAASLHLLTSDFEGSPNSIKEAMACNIPVVSTNVGNVQDLLDGVNGSFVSKSNDIKELAELIIKSFETINYNSRDMLFLNKLDMQSVAIKLNSIYLKIKR